MEDRIFSEDKAHEGNIMKNIIEQIEAEQMTRTIPQFRAGDTVLIKVKVKEGTRERLQSFEGIVIAKRNRGLNSAFTVRKMSHGEGVERVFQTYSPIIDDIVVKRRGDVRRAKLYYLRSRTGNAAKVKEKIEPSKRKQGKKGPMAAAKSKA